MTDPDDRRCISERAIDRTWHSMCDVTNNMAHRESTGSARARAEVEAITKRGGRSRVWYNGSGLYHVEVLE